MKPAETRRLLFIVGMHRSGTSALCAALNACGASFGDQLLDSMADVNEEGFWEDCELVNINEQLLRLLNVEWYTVSKNHLEDTSWDAPLFTELRSEALALLERGFGEGPLEVVKDPRFCITIPFWLSLCEKLSINSHVWVINRAPLEVARSLEKRDGLPVSFGLRLYSEYRKFIVANVPTGSTYLTYDALLNDPEGLFDRIAVDLPLSVAEQAVSGAVRIDLRHQSSAGLNGVLETADDGELDLTDLDEQISSLFPCTDMTIDLVAALVSTGQTLSEKGQEFDESLKQLSTQHIDALATIHVRDSQIGLLDQRLEDTGVHLAQALATIPERDAQIVAIDERLRKLGEEHSYALGVIKERDQQVKLLDELLETRQKLFDLPVIGRLIRKLWFREEG